MHSAEPDTMEHESLIVRRLRATDLEAVIAIDAKATGRRRSEYFKLKLDMAIHETGVDASLAVQIEEMFVGFLIARVYYGDFGVMEPAAVLEVMGVHPDFQGRGCAHALVRQLTTNLLGLGIPRVSMEVAWPDEGMMNFARHVGFQPAPRICLDLDCKGFRAREEARL